MTEILGEVWLRERNQITVPPEVTQILNLSIGDIMRFEINDGYVCVHKAITKKVPTNNYKIGENGRDRNEKEKTS